jgi:hypothetical protein
MFAQKTEIDVYEKELEGFRNHEYHRDENLAYVNSMCAMESASANGNHTSQHGQDDSSNNVLTSNNRHCGNKVVVEICAALIVDTMFDT